MAVISFASLSVLGALAMDMGTGHFSGCIAALMMGAKCPAGSNPFSEANFHLNAAKVLSNFTASQNLLIIISLVLLAFLTPSIIPHNRKENRYFYPLNLLANQFSNGLLLIPIQTWLSLLENSPALFMGRF